MRQQVGRDPAGVAPDWRARWPPLARREDRWRSGADDLLGGGDVAIAGAKDFFDGRDSLCSIGERGNRLSAADSRELLHAQQIGRGEQFIVRLRTDDNDALDAGHLRRHHGHDQVEKSAKCPPGI